jgi:ABC-type sugar transport system, periplasmic component
MKKMLAMTVVLAVCFSILAGCGKVENKGNETTVKSNDQTESQKVETTAVKQEPLTIKLLHFWPGNGKDAVEKTIVADFMKKYDYITVEIENPSVASYYEVLTTKLNTGDMPDVFSGHPGGTMFTYYDGGVTMDLSDRSWVNDLTDGAKRDVTYGGKIQMLPVNSPTMAMAYNKKMFSDLGVKVPDSYAEFIDICDKAKAKGILPMAMGGDGWLYALSIMSVPYIYAKDIDFDQKVNEGKAVFNNDDWKKIFTRVLVEWQQKGYIPKDHLKMDRTTTMLNEFVSGKAAMFFMGAWDVAGIRAAADKDFQLGLFPFPSDNAGGSCVLAATGEGLAAYAKTEQKDAALKFIDYFATKEVDKLFCEAVGSMSVIKGVVANIDPAFNDLIPYIEKNPTHGFINSGWPAEVNAMMGEEIEKVIIGDKTVDQILQTMQDKWREIIDSKKK